MSLPIRLNGKFVETQLDSELIVMQIDSGDFFSVTGTAREIWPLLDGSRDRVTLIELLCDQFAVERDIVESDVDAFLGQLNEAGFLAGA